MYYAVVLFIFNGRLWNVIVSEYITGPISTKFSGLVDIWVWMVIHMGIGSQSGIVVRSLKECCHRIGLS